MRHPRVVVLFQNRLFGEAIARALAASQQVEVATLPAEDASPERLAEMAADAIVLEGRPHAADPETCLLDADPTLTIVVGPEANTAEVYQRHEVIEATASQIITRIMEAQKQPSRRHAPTARSPSKTQAGGPK